MELNLVYQALRRLSIWIVDGYYSEVYIEGHQHVPMTGPVLLAATHPNEMIDIAVLSTTIPHGRHILYWTRSTMFRNPILRTILYSIGAIPVKRHPKPLLTEQGTPSSMTTPSIVDRSGIIEEYDRALLYHRTAQALQLGKVVGLFPEGLSHTQSKMFPLLQGIGRACVEYIRGLRPEEIIDDKSKQIQEERYPIIVPAALVFTNKSKFRSRVTVKYGTPIKLEVFARYICESLESDEETTSEAVAKDIVHQVESSLRDLSINAPDWETICAISMARNILWTNEDRISLTDWVEVSQRLVKFLDPIDAIHTQERLNLKTSLARYHAHLRHAALEHWALCAVAPPELHATKPAGHLSLTPNQYIVFRATLSICLFLPWYIACFALFLPSFLFHIPAYVGGFLTGKLARTGEKEAIVQFRAMGGVLGMGAGLFAGFFWIGKRGFVDRIPIWLWTLLPAGSAEVIDQSSILPGSTVLMFCFSVWLLARWHSLMVDTAYKNYQILLTYCKLVCSVLLLDGVGLNMPEEEREMYSVPPRPADNPFVREHKAQYPDSTTIQNTKAPTQSPNFLTRQFLTAGILERRLGATRTLLNALGKDGNGDLSGFLISKGASLKSD